jgi:hypothetical protein
MKGFRKFGSALVIAGVMAGVMMSSTASLEARGKKGGGGGSTLTTCDYLKTIIDYPYTHYAIKLWALSLYKKYGC